MQTDFHNNVIQWLSLFNHCIALWSTIATIMIIAVNHEDADTDDDKGEYINISSTIYVIDLDLP